MAPDVAPRTSLMLLLGAGASVPADVPDTKEFVRTFATHLESREQEYETLNKILETLERYVEDNPERQVDIELLLETLERLENRKGEILPYFYDGGRYILEEASDKAPIRDRLRDFIRYSVVVEKDKIGYLEPLRELIARYGVGSGGPPLSIFTVNYDNCIEQFCGQYSLDFCDGFLMEWNPWLFGSKDNDVDLYKLHGSISWFRTQSGKHIKIPIKPDEGTVELDTGESAETSIVYPGLKQVYYGPYFDMLGMLKEQLKRTQTVVVAGYSFRDDGIKKIFWDAASMNRDLVVILVSPSALRVYEDELAMQDDGTSSPLEGRVLILPFLFQSVLPLLHEWYISKLQSAHAQERSQERRRALREDVDYAPSTRDYARCGFVEKVGEYYSLSNWHKDWREEIIVCVFSLAHLLARGDVKTDAHRSMLSFYTDSLKRLLTSNVHVETRTSGAIIMEFMPYLVNSEPSGVQEVRVVVENALKHVNSISNLTRRDRGPSVRTFFKPMENVLELYPIKNWPDKVELTEYTRLRNGRHDKDVKRILQIVSEAGEGELSSEHTDEIAEIIRGIEMDELARCFEDWG